MLLLHLFVSFLWFCFATFLKGLKWILILAVDFQQHFISSLKADLICHSFLSETHSFFFLSEMSCHTMFALMSFKENNQYFALLGNKCSRSRWSIAQYKCVHIWADIFPCIFFYHVFDMPHSVKAAVNVMKCLEERVNTL